MLLRLLVLFTIVPFVELAILIWIGGKVGLAATLGLVITTGLLGAALARHEGIRCLRNVQQQLAAGKLPADSLLDGLLILLAGALLITPGVLSDLLGLALLLPPFRRLVKGCLKRRFQARIGIAATGRPWDFRHNTADDRDRIIDTRVIDVSPEEPKQAGDRKQDE